jgi:hypothetical protein
LFTIAFTPKSKEQYDFLKTDPSQEAHYKAVKKTIELLAENTRHRSLETHEFHGLKAPNKEKVFEAYAQQNTPDAYRVFWYYGPGKAQITILLISSHP